MGLSNFFLNEMEWRSGGFSWKFQSAQVELSPGIIKDRKWLLAVSLRNPMFSSRWIRAAINAAAEHRGHMIITLVDEPYVSSMSALSASLQDYNSNIVSLERQRTEQLLRLKRIAHETPVDVEFVLWQDLCKSTPIELSGEINAAFTDSASRVRELVLAQVAIAHREIIDPNIQTQLARFFLDEAPVLINYYYILSPGVIDVYPGPQAPFFWELDVGLLVKELPIASRLAFTRKPHVYCHSSSSAN
jgi:hypothetical protein